MEITPQSLKLFLDFARDAGNWSGTPCVGGNVGGSKEDRGNITQLKRAGLVTTFVSGRDTFIEFTPAGKSLAAKHNISVDG